MQRDKAFGIFYNNQYLGTMIASCIMDCIEVLKCTPCLIMHNEFPGSEISLHAHIDHLFECTPLNLGGVNHYIANLPIFGQISFPITNRYKPPPILFLEKPIVRL